MSKLLVMIVRARPEVISDKSGIHSCKWLVHLARIIESHNVCGQSRGCRAPAGVPAQRSVSS